jgi:hypothetical protein
MSNLSDTDRFLDLRGLSEYSSLGIPTLRDYIRSDALPCFKVKGKLLIKKSEFDAWLERFRVNRSKDLNAICDTILKNLKD